MYKFNDYYLQDELEGVSINNVATLFFDDPHPIFNLSYMPVSGICIYHGMVLAS